MANNHMKSKVDVSTGFEGPLSLCPESLLLGISPKEIEMCKGCQDPECWLQHYLLTITKKFEPCKSPTTKD